MLSRTERDVEPGPDEVFCWNHYVWGCGECRTCDGCEEDFQGLGNVCTACFDCEEGTR